MFYQFGKRLESFSLVNIVPDVNLSTKILEKLSNPVTVTKQIDTQHTALVSFKTQRTGFKIDLIFDLVPYIFILSRFRRRQLVLSVTSGRFFVSFCVWVVLFLYVARELSSILILGSQVSNVTIRIFHKRVPPNWCTSHCTTKCLLAVQSEKRLTKWRLYVCFPCILRNLSQRELFAANVAESENDFIWNRLEKAISVRSFSGSVTFRQLHQSTMNISRWLFRDKISLHSRIHLDLRLSSGVNNK